MNQVLAALRDAPHVSISAIKTYMMCPMKYAHRYVFKTEPSHRSVPLVLGSAVHEALAAFYSHHAEHGEDPQEDLITDAFSKAWDSMLMGDPPVKGDDLGAEKDSELAEAVGLDPSLVRRNLNLTLLRPDLVRRIHAGDEPDGVSLRGLLKEGVPLWREEQETS